jgi:hypothetical protein
VSCVLGLQKRAQSWSALSPSPAPFDGIGYRNAQNCPFLSRSGSATADRARERPKLHAPGEYCFPPLASLITGAARLMLALLEYCVRELGGTYAIEDTDSMAIVATESGGEISCARGRVKALSWEQVRLIAQRFVSLRPYNPKAIPGSILKIEDDNFDPKTGRQRQLFCLAISAKRYALFLLDTKGAPILLRKSRNNKDDRWSEHGLGHLLNPTDPESDDREWIAQVWLSIIRNALRLRTRASDFAKRPAVGRITVSSPAVMQPLENLNSGKPYKEQIKPFNFLLSCHVAQFGHPIGVDPARFHLVGPYEVNARKWLETKWIDQYSGKTYRITTTDLPNRHTARVKTYGEIVTEYEFHPESKCADADGKPCSKQTVGLLERRHIRIEQIKYIGKESNSVEEVDQGLIHSAQKVYTEYPDPRHDDWSTKTLPALRQIPLKNLVKECKGKLSRRALIDLRAGRSRPHPKNQAVLTVIVEKLKKKMHDSERNNNHALQKSRR